MIRNLARTRREKVLLISGLRESESARRSRYQEDVQVWEGTKVWCAPIWKFSKEDINAYIERFELSRNPVVDLIHKSGECLCGAFASPGEKEELRFWFPDVARRLDRLELEARSRGHDWGWGQRPVRSDVRSTAGKNILCASCALSVGEE
jgi:3'-phosphoadenosine 5'-phosphosulfate sulfotransferase (PAPS reductase)/FAD synthetase